MSCVFALYFCYGWETCLFRLTQACVLILLLCKPVKAIYYQESSYYDDKPKTDLWSDLHEGAIIEKTTLLWMKLIKSFQGVSVFFIRNRQSCQSTWLQIKELKGRAAHAIFYGFRHITKHIINVLSFKTKKMKYHFFGDQRFIYPFEDIIKQELFNKGSWQIWLKNNYCHGDQ